MSETTTVFDPLALVEEAGACRRLLAGKSAETEIGPQICLIRRMYGLSAVGAALFAVVFAAQFSGKEETLPGIAARCRIISGANYRNLQREYLNLLRALLRYLGVSTADMEKGVLRAEPTINLIDRESGEKTPKVEIKNLNSIKSVYEAVKYELARQRRAWERSA